MNAHQFWWAWPLQFLTIRSFFSQTKFPFQTIEYYSPWGQIIEKVHASRG